MPTPTAAFRWTRFTEMVDKMREIYRLYERGDALQTAVAPGGHTDTEAIRIPVYSFFLKEFLGRERARDRGRSGRRAASRSN